ncbi:MAG: 2-oxoacid:acceptor oxidoreductase subunit alpha [Actinobacteria bacterium]|nr:2-oxoacid:acceptor oxidoreductase subunit alpha [Actinomycetota bacterium]
MAEIKAFSWKVGGPAGFGIMSTGLIFARIFSRKGYNVVDDKEYPSLIQGGHNVYSVRVSTEKIFSLLASVNILIALDEMTIDLHMNEVKKNGFIVYDSGIFIGRDFNYKKPDVNFLPVPFDRLIEKTGAPKIVKNNVALGVSVALLNYDFNMLKEVITENFKDKGQKIIDFNVSAAKAGFDFIMKEFTGIPKIHIKKNYSKKKLLLTGNDGIFLGALNAGCKFYAAYPMTPSSSILHSFAAAERDFNIVTKHAESEIAVINMAVGASFAGVRSMVATSGGGFALMNEGLAGAAMTETPIVIILCQRPAPATGLPTWTEQGDMLYAVHASHGEFPRVVMAPGDPEESFYMVQIAFNLAEKYQIPVIVMLDKFLSENNFTCTGLTRYKIKINRGKLIFAEEDIDNNEDYLRYKITDDGISPRAITGLRNGVHIANTDEHDEYGFSEESAENRKKMMDKRFIKLNAINKEIISPDLYGPKNADTTIISWGSCKMPILEAMKYLNTDKRIFNFIHFKYLVPFPVKAFKKFMKNVTRSAVIENNKTSQLSRLIMENTGIKINKQLLKYNGRQFLPEEIIKGLEKI